MIKYCLLVAVSTLMFTVWYFSYKTHHILFPLIALSKQENTSSHFSERAKEDLKSAFHCLSNELKVNFSNSEQFEHSNFDCLAEFFFKTLGKLQIYHQQSVQVGNKMQVKLLIMHPKPQVMIIEYEMNNQGLMITQITNACALFNAIIPNSKNTSNN